jgi:hypothetical protein
MQATTLFVKARAALPKIAKRNIGITAPALQKASDPIQQLFLDKVREYKQKSGYDFIISRKKYVFQRLCRPSGYLLLFPHYLYVN